MPSSPTHPESPNFEELEPEEFRLSYANGRRSFREVSMEGYFGEGASFEVADTDFSGASLTSVLLEHSPFSRVNFASSRLEGRALESQFSHCDFSDSRMDLALSACHFSSCSFRNAEMLMARWRDTTFVDCDFSGAQVTGGDFVGLIFDGCNLTDTSFEVGFSEGGRYGVSEGVGTDTVFNGTRFSRVRGLFSGRTDAQFRNSTIDGATAVLSNLSRDTTIRWKVSGGSFADPHSFPIDLHDIVDARHGLALYFSDDKSSVDLFIIEKAAHAILSGRPSCSITETRRLAGGFLVRFESPNPAELSLLAESLASRVWHQSLSNSRMLTTTTQDQIIEKLDTIIDSLDRVWLRLPSDVAVNMLNELGDAHELKSFQKVTRTFSQKIAHALLSKTKEKATEEVFDALAKNIGNLIGGPDEGESGPDQS